MKPFFQDLGVGVGLRAAHHPIFIDNPPPSISWVEVISENFMAWKGHEPARALQTLEKIRKNRPVVLHGVSLNIGSSDAIDFNYLRRLKELIDRIEPAWVSDHLCWTGVRGENFHDLLPVPYNLDSLKLLSEKLDQVQNYLGRKILIENPSSYVEFSATEMTEWDFMTQLLRSTDSGLLLDVNNVYVSSVNHHFDPLLYLQSVPKDRVGQIHLAGHSDMGGYLIDTHDQPVSDAVWELYRWTVEHIGFVSTMIERDGNIPGWSELEMELQRVGGLRADKSKISA